MLVRSSFLLKSLPFEIYCAFEASLEESMSMKPIIESELRNLREELRDLKGYQFKLLSLAATITGFLLSLTRLRLESGVAAAPGSLLYLLPLIVILPSWCIFFDKARTITRIVGYYRIAEQKLRQSQEPTPQEFPGWENSLASFRQLRGKIEKEIAATRKTSLRKRLSHLRATILLIESQRYWVLTYYTFLALAVVCLSIPLQSHALTHALHPKSWDSEGVFLGAAIVLVTVTGVFNGVILARLIWGQHSYDNLALIWKGVLGEQASIGGPTAIPAIPALPAPTPPLAHTVGAPK
jgi:hypothetical protein